MSTLITDSALAARTMSSWPLSIGTALAFETLHVGPNPVYDPDRQIPKGADITRFDSFWINLKTLYRNMLGSVPSQSQESIMAGECLYALEYEVETIREIITTISRGAITPTFYSTDYQGLAKEHPYANIRVHTTPKQLAYHAQETAVMQEFHKRHAANEGVHFLKRRIVPTTPTTGLILTHSAYDLTNSKYFSDLSLLESHTGIVKNKSQWYTKFHAMKDEASIPMTTTMLQVFGDPILFSPFPIAQRKEVIAAAHERHWSAITTKARIRLTFDLMGNKELSAKLIEMLREE